ncbi:hypothetical protein D3C87_1786580 [compost metagenome]
MLLEPLDVQEEIATHGILNEHSMRHQFLNQGFTVHRVGGEHLHLDLLGRPLEISVVVRKVPDANEQQASAHGALSDLFIRPKIGLDRSDPCH